MVTLHVHNLPAPGLPVVVYEGQLDLICGTLGFDMWLRESKWEHLPGFQAAKRHALHGDDQSTLTGFVKYHRNLRLYYIMEAGHMVPIDGMLYFVVGGLYVGWGVARVLATTFSYTHTAPDAAYQMVFDLLYGISAAS